MSLSELQALEFPKLGTEALAKKLLKAQAKLIRRSKMATRKARTKTKTYFRSQYYIATAAADLKTASARNEDILLASLIATVSLFFSFMSMSGEAMLLFFMTGYDIAELSGINMTVLIVIACSIFAVIGAWLAAMLLSMLSISVMDGANRKQHRSFRSTARKSLQYASRVASAWVALLVLVALPLVALAVTSLMLLRGVSNPVEAIEVIFPAVVTAGVASTVLMLINFGLVPYVALFEPEIPLYKALSRSHQLVKRRGRIFILAIYGLLAATGAAAYGISNVINQWIRVPAAVTFTILSGLIIMYINCIMVMFYRKRKMARIK